jgi:uncharacterized protein YuzE
MKIKKDKKLDTAYIQFRKGAVSKTVKVTADLLVDYDKKGRILGIEVLWRSDIANKSAPRRSYAISQPCH